MKLSLTFHVKMPNQGIEFIYFYAKFFLLTLFE